MTEFSANLPTIWPFDPLTTTLFLTAALLYLLLTHHSHRALHHSEPPLIPPRIPLPYIGHILALALQGGHYLRTLGLTHLSSSTSANASSARRRQAALTLALAPSFASSSEGDRATGRMYVVTSPALAHAIQRRSETEMSFEALLPDVVGRVMGLDKATEGIVRAGVEERRGEGGTGVLAELHAMLASRLGTGGGGIEGMVLRAVRELSEGLEDFMAAAYATSPGLAARGGERKQEGRESGGVDLGLHDLLPWVRHLVAPATARLLYGANHPLTTFELEQSFWAFDHGLGSLLLSVFPSVTARRAYTGREKLVAAFRAYIEAGCYESNKGPESEGANPIVLERIRIARAHGFGVDGVARSEVSFLFAGIVNTATTAFWMLVRVFADRELLSAVRHELFGALVETAPEDIGRGVRQLSLKKLLQSKPGAAGCPVLHAVYKEVLRLGSNHASTRLVREDTVVTVPGSDGEGVWFGKGGVVQIAGGVMHLDPAIWGEDVRAFNPGRHLKGKDRDREKDGGIGTGQTAAFRAFGGGKTVCPGRHFATGEILGFVSVVLLRFDLEGMEEDGKGKGRIQVPELDDYILPVHILEPAAGSPVRVRIRLRNGRDGGRVEIVR